MEVDGVRRIEFSHRRPRLGAAVRSLLSAPAKDAGNSWPQQGQRELPDLAFVKRETPEARPTLAPAWSPFRGRIARHRAQSPCGA